MGLRINNEHDRNIVKITAHMALHLAQALGFVTWTANQKKKHIQSQIACQHKPLLKASAFDTK